MVALEVALTRPESVREVMPIAAPAATGPMAIAWNHLQIELIDRLGLDGHGARPRAGDDDLSERGRLRRAVRAVGRARRPAVDRQLSRPPGPQAHRPVRPGHLPDPGGRDGSPRHRGRPGRHRWGARAPGRRRDPADRCRHPGRHPVRAAPGPRPRGRRDRRPASTPATARSARPRGTTRSWSSGTSSRRSSGNLSPADSPIAAIAAGFARDARYCTRAPHGPFDALVPVHGPPRPPPRGGGDGLGHGGRPGLTLVDPGGRPEPIPCPGRRPDRARLRDLADRRRRQRDGRLHRGGGRTGPRRTRHRR